MKACLLCSVSAGIESCMLAGGGLWSGLEGFDLTLPVGRHWPVPAALLTPG